MRRSIVILNLVLLVAGGLVVYRLRAEWKNHLGRVSWVYQGRVAEAAENLASGQPGPAVANWGDIVARSVFHPDRTSVVATAAGGPPPPEPILFGTMNLGSGQLALMSEGQGRGFRQVHIGEAIGAYKLVAVEGQQVSLEWAGGRIRLDAAESASRARSASSSAAGVAPPGPSSTPTAGPKTPSSATVVSPTAPSSSAATSALLGRFPELRGATKEQLADLEREPPGTIRDGKRKRVTAWPFGVQVWWEDVKVGEEKKEQKTEDKR